MSLQKKIWVSLINLSWLKWVCMGKGLGLGVHKSLIR